MIIKCNCVHEFQDERYGLGMRVHNATAKDSTYRCTVCASERRIDNTTVKPKKQGVSLIEYFIIKSDGTIITLPSADEANIYVKKHKLKGYAIIMGFRQV